MMTLSWLTRLSIFLSLALTIQISRAAPNTNNSGISLASISTTVTLMRSKGYLAEDHHVSVQGGKYTLNLVRASNPLVNGGQLGGLPDKEPLLFIHGILMNANTFILMNRGVRPRNYTRYDINSMSIKSLENLLTNDPGSHSLVFTALNFGYEVWLLNRRPTKDTRQAHSDDLSGYTVSTREAVSLEGLVELRNYWNFTLNEQATCDVPDTVEYILKRTGKRKLSIVGHSAGTTISLMALSIKPDLAAKISKALLWAPVLDLENGVIPGLFDASFIAALPLLTKVPSPFLPRSLVPKFQEATFHLCNQEVTRLLVCDPFYDLLGRGTSQLRMENLNVHNHWFEPMTTLEIHHFYQSYFKGLMHQYDYDNPTRNVIAYNRPDPPICDVSRIKLKTMSFWFGNTDQISRLDNFETTRERLTVPIKEFNIGDESNTQFNHLGFQLHWNVSRLLIIPSLKILGTK